MKKQDEAQKKELGRWQKKVKDQGRQIEALKQRLAAADAGAMEMSSVLTAILSQVAVRYGQPEPDPENPASPFGWRLELPMLDVAEALGKYEQHARRDTAKGLYIIGVVPRSGGKSLASGEGSRTEHDPSTDTGKEKNPSAEQDEAKGKGEDPC